MRMAVMMKTLRKKNVYKNCVHIMDDDDHLLWFINFTFFSFSLTALFIASWRNSSWAVSCAVVFGGFLFFVNAQVMWATAWNDDLRDHWHSLCALNAVMTTRFSLTENFSSWEKALRLISSLRNRVNRRKFIFNGGACGRRNTSDCLLFEPFFAK